MTGFMGGRAKPRPRAMPEAGVADFDRALQVLDAGRGDKATKTYLTQVRDATAASNLAREEAEATIAEKKRLEEDLQEAGAKMVVEQQRLGGETSRTRQEITAREEGVAERERLASEREAADQTQRKDLESREAKVAFREGMVEKYFKKGAKK